MFLGRAFDYGTVEVMHILPLNRALPRKIVSMSMSLGLIASGVGLVASSTAAQAATGDVTNFPLAFANAAPEGLALDNSGAMWIAMSAVDQVAKATPTGVMATIAIANGGANAGSHSFALGSDSRMWLTERLGNRIGAFNAANAYQAYDIPTKDSQPMGITAGPDGAMWFTEFAGNKIGRITKNGAITEFALPANSGPTSIVTGPDGALWITMQTGNAIGRMTTSGVLTPYALPNTKSAPTDITLGEDNNLWFTERDGNRLGRMSAKGLLAEFSLPTANSLPEQIALGAQGDLWVTQPGANRISRVTTAGIATEFILPGSNTGPFGIVAGIDGNMWFTSKTSNNLSRLLTGVVPTPNADPNLTATSTKTGATVTANPGKWNYLPSSYTYQWERCSANTDASCQAITGATKDSYVLTDDDASQFVRVSVKATNLNGTSNVADKSARLAIDGLPPKLPPTPVVGAQTVQLVPGVTATLKAAKAIKRGDRRLFRTIFSSNSVKGKVRMSIVNAAGLEVLVIAKGKWVKGNGIAKKVKRIPRSLPKGYYTLKAVYTPRKDQTTVYPIATMSKPIRVK